ncbi:MAG: nuclear transport factor 2 family protein [bacterium]
MRKTLLLITLLGATTAFGLPVPKVIRARYAALTKACDKMDLDKFQSLFDKDYTSTDPEGKVVKRDEFLSMVKGMFSDAKSVRHTLRLPSSDRNRDMVDVKFDFHLYVKGAKGTTHIHEVGTDTWKLVGDTWLCVKTVETVFNVKTP